MNREKKPNSFNDTSPSSRAWDHSSNGDGAPLKGCWGSVKVHRWDTPHSMECMGLYIVKY
ncbi:uncharacterized protein PHALS_03719 [Plasmopara halstedii]|uniref:Uncharacterized protein n=1 Tax=Plasmopara halstedii TaxID=4781 RepID=A0A0P1B131_PLAHL|nr:uncharacterized protein PHALS_03719 [Plasmopara halstedii]CEG47057.1 hypothetical protein PHALS_03719 [Plasmopara halstedii]|eukprot:XP_024583426.1 hypothetical protein PHALS_03719 [Plasmopara halstedii]